MANIKDIFKKIPFLKNVDLDDPKARQNLIFMLAAILGVIVIVFVAINDFIPKENEEIAQTEESASGATLEIPNGEDNDVLGATSNVAAIDAASKSAYSRTGDLVSQMFEESSVYNKDVDGMSTGNSSSESTSSSSTTSREDAINDRLHALGLDGSASPSAAQKSSTGSGRTNVYGQESSTPKTSTPSTESSTATRRQGRRSDAQSALLAMGSDEPATPAPSAGSSPKTTAPAQVTTPKSGSMSSSLDDDWNSMGSLDDLDAPASSDHPFRVMFLRNEKISSGQRVTLRLLEDMIVSGVTIPKNTHLSAVCSINERLSIVVSNVEINGRIYTLNLEGYDSDGGKGLYCPNTGTSQTAQSAVNEASQVTRSALQRSFSGLTSEIFQAGATVLTNAKGESKITVTSGYEFFLVAKND